MRDIGTGGNMPLHLISKFLLNPLDVHFMNQAQSIVTDGANINAVNQLGESPLHTAVNHFRIMAETFSWWNIADQFNGVSNLNNYLHFLGFLISCGADESLVDYQGKKALQNLHEVMCVYYPNHPRANIDAQALRDFYIHGERVKAIHEMQRRCEQKYSSEELENFCANL